MIFRQATSGTRFVSVIYARRLLHAAAPREELARGGRAARRRKHSKLNRWLGARVKLSSKDTRELYIYIYRRAWKLRKSCGALALPKEARFFFLPFDPRCNSIIMCCCWENPQYCFYNF